MTHLDLARGMLSDFTLTVNPDDFGIRTTSVLDGTGNWILISNDRITKYDASGITMFLGLDCLFALVLNRTFGYRYLHVSNMFLSFVLIMAYVGINYGT